MDLTERLRAWGAAHAKAVAAESTARQASAADWRDLRREAQSLRERADRLHGEIYRSLDKPGRDER